MIKVKLSGEDYHDIVIDWTDTSQAYEQQVFSRVSIIVNLIPVLFLSSKKYQKYLMSKVKGLHENCNKLFLNYSFYIDNHIIPQLAEITGIPVEQTSEMCFLTRIYRAVGFPNKREEPELE